MLPLFKLDAVTTVLIGGSSSPLVILTFDWMTKTYTSHTPGLTSERICRYKFSTIVKKTSLHFLILIQFSFQLKMPFQLYDKTFVIL